MASIIFFGKLFLSIKLLQSKNNYLLTSKIFSFKQPDFKQGIKSNYCFNTPVSNTKKPRLSQKRLKYKRRMIRTTNYE